MTFNYYLKEKKEKGRTEGLAEGKNEMAKALKDKGVVIDIIAETSGLSVEGIEKL